MKTIKVRIQKSSQWVAILVAAVVAIITSAVVANATQTFTTPNEVNLSFNLTTGTNSAAITPTSSKPVLVMGCTPTFTGDQSIGQVSLLHIPGQNIAWVGLEAGNAAATAGKSSATGTHIVYVDANHHVDIQVASADTIHIHNGTVSTVSVNVTLIW